MQHKKDILNELNDLKVNLPLVEMPDFTMPKGYFDELSANLMENIKLDDFTNSLPKSMPFDIPQNYFEQLEDDLKTNLFLEQLPKSNPYSAPDENYFNDFAAQMTSHIYLDQISNKNPLSVPSSYFDTQHDQIMSKTKINAPIQNSSRRFAPLSMAASILFFIGLGFLMFNQTSKPSVEQQLAAISSAEIENYIQAHQMEFDTDLVLEGIDESRVDVQTLESEIIENQLNTISEEELSSYIL
jgi:hypothetical protein